MVADKRRARSVRFLNVFSAYVRCNLSAGMAYRGAFIAQVFGMFLNNSAFIVFWLILFDRIGADIKGYAFQDVMFLWSLAAVGYGLAEIFMGNARMLSRTIYQGELDVYLLQPKPVLMNFVVSRMGISSWGDMLYGLVLFVVSQPLTASTVCLFLLLSVLSAFVFTAVTVFYHSLTFFLGNAENFAGAAGEMVLSFTLYPGSIFEGPSVLVLHTVLPAAFLAYIPQALFKAFDLRLFLLLLVVDCLIVAAAVLFFHRGLKRYESGNRIGARV